mmetsp:Transcript_39569/g.29221  ORF Transcript_39569/g.29221 Transcript_39569/m.29221 type:complete len:94 (-) Transcript_39569:239-520(-)
MKDQLWKMALNEKIVDMIMNASNDYWMYKSQGRSMVSKCSQMEKTMNEDLREDKQWQRSYNASPSLNKNGRNSTLGKKQDLLYKLKDTVRVYN